jgi:hypothetical protein
VRRSWPRAHDRATVRQITRSNRAWIGFNDNSEGGITVYSVACHLLQGLQVDVFAFKNDAYLYLVDQAEGLTDEQRIELGQLAELPDREAFWTLHNRWPSKSTCGYPSRRFEVNSNIYVHFRRRVWQPFLTIP